MSMDSSSSLGSFTPTLALPLRKGEGTREKNRPLPAYAELHCLTNFSFQRGASHAEELVERAIDLGYAGLAITDECSLAGVVRAHLALQRHKEQRHCEAPARKVDSRLLGNDGDIDRHARRARDDEFRLIIGSEFRLHEGPKLILLATDRASYGRLVGFITLGRRQADKGSYRLSVDDLQQTDLEGCLCIWLPDGEEAETGQWLKEKFPQRLWIGVALLGDRDDRHWLAMTERLAATLALPRVACGDVHMHVPERQPLQDVMTAIHHGIPVAESGRRLFQNAERHLRPRERLGRIYPPGLLAETITITRRCRFSLAELRYEYPAELVPDGHTPGSWLRVLTEQGMQQRWPSKDGKGAPNSVRQTIERELALIAELNYEPFFLTVHDAVAFARRRGILCQGRGSAANSAVCYALGITEVDPARLNLLFERFISRERNEPPDIDVDFEHERREEVIQYLYDKYGRHRAALAATVICYRPRSAIRDVGKALGFSLEEVDRLAKSLQWWDKPEALPARLTELGFDPGKWRIRQLLKLVSDIIGFPRHLSQHVGGFVIARHTLADLVPVENASMAERTIIQWDKDDLEALGLLKVDVLALGMLTAIRKCFEQIEASTGRHMTMADIPEDDPAVWETIQRADTVGTFQIESRAQMTMLPRLKPACFYDLVIEVAIVRPGPIQGDMVHPYLERRRNPALVEYPSPAVRQVLERTLGVPIFQEQVMQLAVVAAGFTPGEADDLRRSMAAWKKKGGLEKYERKLFAGMRERGYPEEFAQRIFNQIKGFGEYGFPESHSASFALLAWVSCWLKHHYPAAYCAAMLNSQPLGFYAPAQLVQDAQRHNVTVLPVDIRYSDWDCHLEDGKLRLGLRRVAGLAEAAARRLLAARTASGRTDIDHLAQQAGLDRKNLEALAAAGALRGEGHRHRAFWQVAGIEPPLPLLTAEQAAGEADPLLPLPSEGQNIVADYASTGLTLERHPVALLRERLDARRVTSAAELWQRRSGTLARVAGLVINRQRPGTATGVIFMTLEDETGHTNLIVWPRVAERQRRALLESRLLLVHGTVQQEDGVLHLIAGKLTDLSDWLGELNFTARNFH